MAKKISIALTSSKTLKFSIPVKEDFTDLNKLFLNLSRFINSYSMPIFVSLLFLLPGIQISERPAFIIIFYALILLVLFNRILRTLFIKGDHFVAVPFDLQLLTFTTAISLSFFYNTAVTKANTNIWGGAALKEISGISLIAYWFLFYFLQTHSRNKLGLKKLLLSFWIAPTIALLGSLILGTQLQFTAFTLIILMHPALLYLALKYDSYNKLHTLNLFISTILLLLNPYEWTTFVIIITYLLLFIFLILSRRNQLTNMLFELDKIARPFNLKQYIRQNSTLIMICISLLIALIGSRYLFLNITQSDYLTLEKGYQELTKLSGLALVFGQGMHFSLAPKIVQLILSFGWLPFLILSVIAVNFIFHFKKLLKKTSNTKTAILLKFFSLMLFPVTMFLFLSPFNTELFFIFIITLISFVFLLQSLSVDKQSMHDSNEMLTHSHLKSNELYFLKSLKLIILVILIALFIYLLSYLNYINIFINT